MPGNLYGVSQPGFTAVIPLIGGDVVCNAGVETNVYGQAISAPSQGNWYLVISGVLVILMGATAPGAISIGARIGAAADFDSYNVGAAMLVNNATISIPILLMSAANQSNFFPGGSTFNFTLNATGQNITAKNLGSRLIYQLFRGPDA